MTGECDPQDAMSRIARDARIVVHEYNGQIDLIKEMATYLLETMDYPQKYYIEGALNRLTEYNSNQCGYWWAANTLVDFIHHYLMGRLNDYIKENADSKCMVFIMAKMSAQTPRKQAQGDANA